jgi:hypothetical protein
MSHVRVRALSTDMTSAFTSRSAPRSASDDSQHLRLRMKPRGPVTGFVDGAWWPRSRNLAAEVPALLAELVVLVVSWSGV